MKTKRFSCVMLFAVLMLLTTSALASRGVYHTDYTDEPPQRILNSVADRWPGYVLEDYVFLSGPSPDVAAALVESRGHRVLALYRKQNGLLSFWFSTDKAVPQGEGEAWFDKTGEQVFVEGKGWQHAPDNMGFAVTRYDLLGDTYNQMVTYSWKNNGFHLTDYADLDAGDTAQAADVGDGVVTYYAYGEGNRLGRAYGEIQTDIRYVNFSVLPKTLKEAKNKLTYAPDDLPTGRIVPSGERLEAKSIKFTGGRNYPVYLGPGEEYQRSGNGKGTVSTNDWIQVFGRYENWIMIQYDISADQFRIGWIEASALPYGADVLDIDLVMLKNDDYNDVIERCVLTDDPFNSQKALAVLEVGTPLCEIVYNIGGWSYVRVTIDGVNVCGFVPSDSINHG